MSILTMITLISALNVFISVGGAFRRESTSASASTSTSGTTVPGVFASPISTLTAATSATTAASCFVIWTASLTSEIKKLLNSSDSCVCLKKNEYLAGFVVFKKYLNLLF